MGEPMLDLDGQGAKPARITAADIRAALSSRYSGPEWCLFFEVANGTGSGSFSSEDERGRS